ncbi:arginine deiminase [Babesia ovata]|uniref:Arginine deiminase n=1 Tax=Babesia ovata TaxID=189622 RepID=A0A2H6KC43_9APIC|nr:arginine deiminase [Babesia ovata]GBE60557.1 arginine deiminase [Babesia ovata]
MRRSLFSIILLLPLLCSAAEEEALPKRPDSKNRDRFATALEFFTKLSENSKKGGAAIAKKVVSENIGKREDFFQAAYATLERSPFSGPLPRCLCKAASCALAPCYSMCTGREAVNSDIFDCTSCVGDCIPMLKFVFLALFALLQPAASIENIRVLLDELRTKEASIIADTIDVLKDEYDYSEDLIKKAFARCRDESGVTLVPCFIDSLHVQKVLQDHKYQLCAFDYVLSVAADCAADCFGHYNVNCLTCVGKPMPNFINCLKKGPHQYSSYTTESTSKD